MQSVKQEVRDLERVRYVTENYEDLQGLTRIPVGLIALVVHLFVVFTGFEVNTKFVADIVLTLALLVGVMLVIGFFRIRRYYENKYGRVKVIPCVFTRERIHSGLVAFAVVFIAFGLGLWVADSDVPEPYPLFFLFLGLTKVIDRWPEKSIRPHHFAFVALMALAGLTLWTMEVLGASYPEVFLLHLFVAVLVLYLFVGGILDHLLLTRTMKSLPGDDDGRAV